MGAEFSSELDAQEKRDLLRQCGARYRLATGARAVARLAWAPLAAVAIAALVEHGVVGPPPVDPVIEKGGLIALALVACMAEKTRAFIVDKMAVKQASKPSSRERRAAHCASKWLGLALFAIMAIYFNERDEREMRLQKKVAENLSKMTAPEIMRAMPFFTGTTGEGPSADNVRFERKDGPAMALALEMKRRGFDRQEDEEKIKEQALRAGSSYKPSRYWTKYGPMGMSAMMAAAWALSLCVMAKSSAVERGFKWAGSLSSARSLALGLGKAGKAAGMGAIKAPWRLAVAIGGVILSLAKALARAPRALLAAPKEAAAVAGSLAKSCAKARQSLIDRGMGGPQGWSEAERTQIAAEIPEDRPAASTRRRL